MTQGACKRTNHQCHWVSTTSSNSLPIRHKEIIWSRIVEGHLLGEQWLIRRVDEMLRPHDRFGDVVRQLLEAEVAGSFMQACIG